MSHPQRPKISTSDRSLMASAATARAAAVAPPPPIAPEQPAKHSVHDKINKKPSKVGALIFAGVLVGGLVFIGSSIAHDLAGIRMLSALRFHFFGAPLPLALALR